MNITSILSGQALYFGATAIPAQPSELPRAGRRPARTCHGGALELPQPLEKSSYDRHAVDALNQSAALRNPGGRRQNVSVYRMRWSSRSGISCG
jgi:hypothetical protein